MSRILVISDLHCGGIYGLLPSNYIYPGVREVALQQNTIQSYMWDYWLKMIESIGHVDVVVVNGDAVEGLNKKSGGKDILIPDLRIQADIAVSCLSMINTDDFVFTQGSKYHVDDNPSGDELVCDLMSGIWFGYFGDLTVDDVKFNIQHKSPFSDDPSNRYNSVQKKINNANMQNNEELAKIYIRSHTHFFGFSGNTKRLVVNTPCWKGMDGFVSENSQQFPDNGWVVFDVNDGKYSFDYYTFKLPRSICVESYTYKKD